MPVEVSSLKKKKALIIPYGRSSLTVILPHVGMWLGTHRPQERRKSGNLHSGKRKKWPKKGSSGRGKKEAETCPQRV